MDATGTLFPHLLLNPASMKFRFCVLRNTVNGDIVPTTRRIGNTVGIVGFPVSGIPGSSLADNTEFPHSIPEIRISAQPGRESAVPDGIVTLDFRGSTLTD